MVYKKIEIDISGQIQQVNYDSALGFRRDNGIEKSVFLRSKDKKEIIKKYKYVRVGIKDANPIMLCLKASSIHTAPPGNSYNNHKI